MTSRIFRRDRIETVASPRVTSGQPFDAEPAAAQCAMAFDSFEKIMGATWLEPAAPSRTADERQDGPDQQLIPANEEIDEELHDPIAKSAARVASARHSSRN